MKHTCIALALAVATVVTLMSGDARAGITVNPSDGSYDVATDNVAFHYQPLGTVVFSQVGLYREGMSKDVVFSYITAGPFEPVQQPVEIGRTVKVDGNKASFEAHDTGHATLLYRTVQYSNITYTLSPEAGAVSFGNKALVGDAYIKADLAVIGGRVVTKSEDDLILRLQPSDTAIFRVQGPAGSIGDLIESDVLGAELDVRTMGNTIDSDMTAYRAGAQVAVEMAGTNRISFSYSGLESKDVVIINLASSIYAQLKSGATLSRDDSPLARFSDLEDLEKSSEPGFTISECQSYAEMIVRPGATSGSLVVELVQPGLDLLLVVAAFASVAVSFVAAAYLFRRKGR